MNYTVEKITESGVEYDVAMWVDGRKEWSLNGKLHRLDGPAMEWADGSKEWFLNGKRHRLDEMEETE